MNAPFLPARSHAESRTPSFSGPFSGEILPHELPQALDRVEGVRVLSLDCFDTLIWRDCHAPVDIFTGLPGISTAQRRWAEASARRIAGFWRGKSDVAIAEIYNELLLGASPSERQDAIAAELAAEIRHCFAFAPTVELMRQAKAQGIKVVIVSDTYLNAAQLRLLIAGAAGEEVAGLIDKIFASSTFGKPKAGGLYGEVLKKLAARPHQILHIGDNKGADVHGVAPFGVNTLHLKQFSEGLMRQFRLESSVDAMIHGQAPIHAPAEAPAMAPKKMAKALQPHRAALALAEPSANDPAFRFGLTVLGPVMAGFERWLKAEAEALQAKRGGKIHWLFMMRDGYLPMQVHLASGQESACHAIEISRVTAIASSFLREDDALRYATRKTGIQPILLARQLLIPEADIEGLIEGRNNLEGSLALLAELHKGPRRRAILEASRAMARRLVQHVRTTVDPAPGDTLMMIDLGYNGTVQNHVDALLQRELGVHVAGRYLLLREAEQAGLDKAGMIDEHHYDPNILEALCTNVAVLEQLATAHMGSVVDYTEEGEPIRRANTIGRRQNETRERVQAGVLAFAGNAAPILRADREDEAMLWRRGAASVLARLLYLPTPEELAVIARFEHDVNYGSANKVALFDPEEAARGLRQRGLFYLKGSERMYLPAELSGHGLPSRLALFAAQRFDLPFTFDDFSDARIDVPVIFVDSETGEMIQETLSAHATHDGFFMAAIPLGEGRYNAAVQLGMLAEWVEVNSIDLVKAREFLGNPSLSSRNSIPLKPLADGMNEVAPRLWQANGPAGFLMIQPPRRTPGEKQVAALVFRPIVRRGAAAAHSSPLEQAA